MKCQACATENPENAKFCLNCGRSLAIKCPHCATNNLAGARFCTNCGANLTASDLSAAPAQNAIGLSPVPPSNASTEAPQPNLMVLEGERRVVTVLFCDVTGSTAIAESMDPEEWAGIMNEVFQQLMEPVSRYGGTIARLMGDAILAFFGAPTAHEDDPLRAVLTGLGILDNIAGLREKMRQRFNIDFNVRVGINTGLVVVGNVGSDLRAEYTAMGDAVNLAARMEQTAAPGTIQIAEETYRFVASLFEFQPLGAIEVKGKKDRVPAYRVLRRKPGAMPTRGITGLQSPLVGREPEFALLQEQVTDLLRNQGKIISVIAEAGLGKSRLVAELRHWAEDQNLLSETRKEPSEASAPVVWLEGRSFSYQTLIPYAAWKHLLRKHFGLDTVVNETNQAYEQVRQQVASIASHPEQIAPLLATIMDLPVEGEDAERIKYLPPPQLRERVFQAVINWVRALTQQQKLILVFDDIHWMDSTSIELIETLFEQIRQRPVILLALFRPNHQDLCWKVHERAEQRYHDLYTPIFLQPLDENQSRQLVANLLEIEDLPEKIRSLILKKAEGNPFFVEEVIRSLLDAKLVIRQGDHWVAMKEISDIHIPETLVRVITSRLDRLDEHTRLVAQEAAVIGREFAHPLLADLHQRLGNAPQVLDPSIDKLQQRDLVRIKHEIPQQVLAFKHVLTQETAYASLLINRRRALHLKVAECLEASEPTQTGEIARHFMEARAFQRALPYLVQAGGQAARNYATIEAIHYFNLALEILPQTSDLALARKAYEGLGRALTFANQIPEAVETYQKMYAYGQEKGNIPVQVSALNKLSDINAMRMGQFPEADKLLKEAENLARQVDDKPGLAELFMIRCGVCTAAGDFHGAVDYLGEAVQIAQSLDQAADVALGLAHIANTQVWMTEWSGAWATAQRSLKIAREIGNRELQADVMAQALPICYWREGNYRQAYQVAWEGARIANEIGASFPESMGAFLAGRMAWDMGDYESALECEQQAIQAGQAFGMPFLSMMGICSLGSIYLEIGEAFREKTIALHTQAVEMLELPGSNIGGGAAWLDLGFCALTLGDEQRASDFFQKGFTTPNPQMFVMRPHYLIGLALIASLQGNFHQAQEYLDQAAAYARNKAMQNYEPLLVMMQGQLQARQEQPEPAFECFEKAASLAAQYGLRPIQWQAHVGAAQALRSMGQVTRATAQLEQAWSIITQIADLFRSDSLRLAFLGKSRRQISHFSFTGR